MSDLKMCKKGLHELVEGNLYREGRHGRMSCASCRRAARAISRAACSVEGCPNGSKNRGLCMTHYERQRRRGTVDGPMSAAEVAAEVEWLMSLGVGLGDVLTAVKKKPLTLSRLLLREGRNELAATFQSFAA